MANTEETERTANAILKQIGEDIGRVVLHERQKRGLTQQQLAELVGVTKQSIHRLTTI